MVIGVGIDVVDESRFRRHLIRTPRLRERISRQVDFKPKSTSDFAKFFAILEALYKALPDNQKNEILNYRISKDISGRPIINYQEKVVENRRDYSLHVSVSHEKCFVVAVVIVEIYRGEDQLL